jgi:hypothetical protein
MAENVKTLARSPVDNGIGRLSNADEIGHLNNTT